MIISLLTLQECGLEIIEISIQIKFICVVQEGLVCHKEPMGTQNKITGVGIGGGQDKYFNSIRVLCSKDMNKVLMRLLF